VLATKEGGAVSGVGSGVVTGAGAWCHKCTRILGRRRRGALGVWPGIGGPKGREASTVGEWAEPCTMVYVRFL
jgi:hypothetical protein